jgi:hypothetical protein
LEKNQNSNVIVAKNSKKEKEMVLQLNPKYPKLSKKFTDFLSQNKICGNRPLNVVIPQLDEQQKINNNKNDKQKLLLLLLLEEEEEEEELKRTESCVFLRVF